MLGGKESLGHHETWRILISIRPLHRLCRSNLSWERHHHQVSTDTPVLQPLNDEIEGPRLPEYALQLTAEGKADPLIALVDEPRRKHNALGKIAAFSWLQSSEARQGGRNGPRRASNRPE